jgi:hypothetical protein
MNLKQLYLEEALTVSEIAAKIGKSDTRVYECLHDLKIQTIPAREQRIRRVCRLLDQNKLLFYIAPEIGKTPTSLLKFIAENDVLLKPENYTPTDLYHFERVLLYEKRPNFKAILSDMYNGRSQLQIASKHKVTTQWVDQIEMAYCLVGQYTCAKQRY